MSAGISTLALCAPLVASNAIFSARRVSRGVDAIEENPAYALANIDIAAGQILKGGRAAKGIALSMASNENSRIILDGATDILKTSSNTGKFMKGLNAVLNFTADNINPIIVAAGIIKVLGSEDKVETGAREATALSMMFLAEGITKNTIGMPKIKRENGRIISEPVESLYSIHKERIPFISKQVDALVDYCETKKMFNKISLKGVPAVMKGLMFVSASILGYKLGNKVADCFLGKKEDSKCN